MKTKDWLTEIFNEEFFEKVLQALEKLNKPEMTRYICNNKRTLFEVLTCNLN